MPDGSGLTGLPNRDLPTDMKDRLIAALDVPSVQDAKVLIQKLDGIVSFFKIGYWLYLAEGVDDLYRITTSEGRKLFLDAKMFDVPETVAQAIGMAVKRKASFVTVHGDERIMKAAVEAKGDSELKIFAVTVLTSLDDAALKEMGYRLTAKELVALRARKAVEAKCEGIIASADDNPDTIRDLAGHNRLLIATPGIRPAGSAPDDQKRIATPGEAIRNGADYLVIGRPITQSSNPRKAAEDIIAEMQLGWDEYQRAL